MADNTQTPDPGSQSLWSTVAPLLSGGLMAYGSSAAGRTSAAGYDRAANYAGQGLSISQGALNPYAQGGAGAYNALLGMYGVGGKTPNYAPFFNSPMYQFPLQQGDAAIRGQNAATGNLYSASTMAALDKFNSGLAGSYMDKYLAGLAGMAGIGVGAAGAAGSQAVDATKNQGQFTAGSANANASGVAGAAGALGRTLGGVNWGNAINGIKGLFGNADIQTYSDGGAYDPNTGFTLKNGVFYDDQGNPISGGDTSTSAPADYSGVDPSIFGGVG